MGEKIRLDKYLAEMGLGTRSQIKEAARKGRIRVNGVTEKGAEKKIDPDSDTVLFDGQEITYVRMEYYLLNKPQGVVSATEDRIHPTVVSLLTQARRSDLFPVGRLDIDTEGLLLITNDGELAHRLLSPKKHVDKQYYALVSGRLARDAVEQAAAGMVLADGTKLLAAKLEILPGQGRRWHGGDGRGGLSAKRRIREEGQEEPCFTEIRLTLQEGKFHQVKRMVEALGGTVVYLKRLSMGPLKLEEGMRPGEYRRLTQEEVLLLKEWTGEG